MIYQQYTTAIEQAYRDHPDLPLHASKAKQCREWLESLQIDPQLRTTLVEQAQTLEEAFRRLLSGP